MALSAETKTKLANFLVEDIGPKEVLDGITYVLLSGNERDVAKAKELTKIQAEVDEAGVNHNNVLRSYKVSNGMIFDLNLGVAKQTSEFITQSMCKAGAIDKSKLSSADLIKDGPDKRRYEDIVKLGKYLKTCYDKKQYTVDVALFSRNKVGTTTFNAKKDGKDVTVKYNAYAIRHWDIQSLNENILYKLGFGVSKLEAGEILPSKNGVRFRLTLSKVN